MDLHENRSDPMVRSQDTVNYSNKNKQKPPSQNSIIHLWHFIKLKFTNHVIIISVKK